MTLDQRLERLCELCDESFEMARDEIRARHPEYEERQLFLAFARDLHGDEIYVKAWPGQPTLEP